MRASGVAPPKKRICIVIVQLCENRACRRAVAEYADSFERDRLVERRLDRRASADTVGIRAHDLPSEEDGVDGFGAPRFFRQHLTRCERFFFERVGDVASRISLGTQTPDRWGRLAAGNSDRNVAPIDLGVVEEASVQPGAAAVLDRVADQCELHPRRPRSIKRSKNRKNRVTAKSLSSIGSVRIV